jgi:hypothetical protein
MGFFTTDHSCNGEFACLSNHGVIASNACNGFAACHNNSGNIGSGQCHGDRACEKQHGQQTIADSSHSNLVAVASRGVR